MRPYAITVPTIWTGQTGTDWRERGKDYQLLGHYLISSPYSNMYGLYYQPFSALVHEVGVEPTMAETVLGYFSETRFAFFDKRSNWVWLVNGWRVQFMSSGKPPAANDKRIIGLHRWYGSCPVNPFLGMFFDEYGPEFNIPNRRSENSKPGAMRPPAAHPQRPMFERWSAEYPNPDGMGAAWNIWQAIEPAPTMAYVESVMLPALTAQKATERWQDNGGKFIPNASRYLQERRWEDRVYTDGAQSNEVDDWLRSRRQE